MALRNLDEYMALAGLPAGAAIDDPGGLPVRSAENASDLDPFVQSTLNLGFYAAAAYYAGALAWRLVLLSFNLQGDPVP